ncbi:MAG TPA: hypothetical protein VND64_23730 [Pirellulales bacterium]|nr:hypothetical protein [Pirellulales bacterium]
MAKVTRETIIEAAKQLAAQQGRPLSRRQFNRQTGVGKRQISHLFERGWSEVVRIAGIQRHPQWKTRLADDELLKAFHKAASNVGAIPTWEPSPPIPVFRANP